MTNKHHPQSQENSDLKTNKDVTDEDVVHKVETIGQILRKYRIENKIKTSDIARSFNVKEQDILDLENDVIYDKKSTAYVNGLIRGYQKLLKINDPLSGQNPENLSRKGLLLNNYELPEESSYTLSPKQIIQVLFLVLISYLVFFCDFSKNDDLTTELIIERINQSSQ